MCGLLRHTVENSCNKVGLRLALPVVRRHSAPDLLRAEYQPPLCGHGRHRSGRHLLFYEGLKEA